MANTTTTHMAIIPGRRSAGCRTASSMQETATTCENTLVLPGRSL